MSSKELTPDAKILFSMFYVVFVCVSVPLLVLYTGYCFSTLWTWFIVPFGVSPISVMHAAGLLLFATLINNGRAMVDYEKNKWEIFRVILMPGMCLIFGYIYKLFM